MYAFVLNKILYIHLSRQHFNHALWRRQVGMYRKASIDRAGVYMHRFYKYGEEGMKDTAKHINQATMNNIHEHPDR